MRSYHAHLATFARASKKHNLSKPVFRSSAIFPVIHNPPHIFSRALFMGYWIPKRHIQKVTCLATLRSQEGKVLSRETQAIQEAKAYRIEVEKLLHKGEIEVKAFFLGSLEVEFFSTTDLVIPYPATALNYYGPHSSSVVHTAQRVYNDFEDMMTNSETSVPESGFNLYADENKEPFFALINGNLPVPNSRLDITFFNSKNDKLTHQLHLGDLSPYQTQMIHPAQSLNLKEFFGGSVGAAKVRFQAGGIYPRLVVGNWQHSRSAAVITHTYYDCSESAKDSDYWLEEQAEWYPASLLVPLSISGSRFTKVHFYPIYSPSHLAIDVEIYSQAGELLGKKENVLQITSPPATFEAIEMKTLCQELGIPEKSLLGARVIARPLNGSRFPARVKIGLDLGQVPGQLPCNICTNLYPFQPSLEGKPCTFRWAPLLTDQPHPSLWIMNSSPAKNYQKRADIDLTFYREADNTTISHKITIPPHGFLALFPNKDEELNAFFQGKIGWATAISTNPYTSTYYFAEHPSGIVGGDHGF